MTTEQYRSHLAPPTAAVDAILDTDTYNELDDQFALSYMLRSGDRIRVRALTAAPFYNSNSTSPEDGMERSYDEILKILKLSGRTDLTAQTYRGSRTYLPDEKTPVESEAARAICRLAMEYTEENPLYVVAIGAITNVASALLMQPEIADRIVIVWLGGHAFHWPHTKEFNMVQDIAAARVVFSSGAPLVQLPCMGVVSEFRVSGPELTYWLAGKNPVADYLASNTIGEVERHLGGTAWTRVIWDATAVGFLLNEGNRFMRTELRPIRLPAYDGSYEKEEQDRLFCYVAEIYRDALMTDMMHKLAKG